MALVKCPECGREVSDKAKKCPQCGYELGKYKAKRLLDQIPKPHLKKKTIVIVLIVLILLFIGADFFKNRKIEVDNIKMDKWTMTSTDDISDKYECQVISDTKEPFIALIGEYEDKDSIPGMVYMEDGKGIYETKAYGEDEDPSLEYTPIGYINGQKIERSDIKKLDYTVDDYLDLSYDKTTVCDMKFTIELKSKYTGIMLFKITNDRSKEVIHNKAIPIVNGVGEGSIFMMDLPYKARGVEIFIEPQIVCQVRQFKEGDYNVEKEATFEKEENDGIQNYSGEAVLSFKNLDTGYILYTSELISGGSVEDRGELERSYDYITNNKCEFNFYTSGEEDEILQEPEYDVNLMGYITYNKIKQK